MELFIGRSDIDRFPRRLKAFPSDAAQWVYYCIRLFEIDQIENKGTIMVVVVTNLVVELFLCRYY